ncbi:unnamed protein product [Porites lobata]|uniref:Uncharacterized protein n=1 Tax=Porites lobata TaxID=104759 RepID=A0ABN8NBM6_9CNID|nr:unnamed protein product [Porites lobata]
MIRNYLKLNQDKTDLVVISSRFHPMPDIGHITVGSECIAPRDSVRNLGFKYLVVPRSRLKTYGDRAFSIAGPKLWNDLPLEIRKCASVATFKQSLKTFLFKLAYRL